MEISREEEQLKVVVGILAIAFLIADLVLVFATPQLFGLVNTVADTIGVAKTPIPVQHFYLALTNSMMIMLVYMSYMVWKNVKRNLNMVPAIMVCKFASSATGLLIFIFSARYLTYLVIPLTDFPIFLILFVLYRRVQKTTG